MAFEQRDNSGALFANGRKLKDNHPDYIGNGMVNGKLIRISGWKKQSAKGVFLSLSFSEPQESNMTPKSNSFTLEENAHIQKEKHIMSESKDSDVPF